MKGLLGWRQVNQVALAALALWVSAVPGKAQSVSAGAGHQSSAVSQRVLPVVLARNSEAPACTSYPEWSCEPEAVGGQEAVSTTTAESGANCTSYPEWSCEPQSQSGPGRDSQGKQIERSKRGLSESSLGPDASK